MDNHHCDSTDSEDTAREFLFPTASSTPVPSRSTSPLPQFYPSTSDSDTEPSSPLLWREPRHPWWSDARPRRKRGPRALRVTKRWLRHLVRHPFFPSQPFTIASPPLLISRTILILHRFSLLSYFLSLPYPSPCSLSTFSIPTRNLSPGALTAPYHH